MERKFVDTHNHSIWDIDDGVQNEEAALKLLQSAQRSNIGVIFVTPHFIPRGIYEPTKEQIFRGVQKLRELAEHHHIDINILSGCEFRITADSLNAIEKGKYITFEDTDYVLIEFTRQNAKDQYITDAIEKLIAQGKKPIVAHPERYFEDLSEAKEFVQRWIGLGCVISVNRTSLLNQSRKSFLIAWELVNSGLVHIIPTDAHHGEGVRMCLLDDIYGIISTRYGKEFSDRLFFINPWHIVKNENIESVI